MLSMLILTRFDASQEELRSRASFSSPVKEEERFLLPSLSSLPTLPTTPPFCSTTTSEGPSTPSTISKFTSLQERSSSPILCTDTSKTSGPTLLFPSRSTPSILRLASFELVSRVSKSTFGFSSRLVRAHALPFLLLPLLFAPSVADNFGHVNGISFSPDYSKVYL